jgi:hypothetical protein
MAPPSLRIDRLELRNIGCFKEIDVNFVDGFNFICGSNGVGKSTLLNTIGRAFSHHQSGLRRRADSTVDGTWSVSATIGKTSTSFEGSVKGLMHDAGEDLRRMGFQFGAYLLFFRGARDFIYSQLGAISRDPQADANIWSEEAVAGVSSNDMKRWLANRFMFSAHAGSLSPKQILNLDFAKRCFSILDPTVEFETVAADTFEILVRTPQGSIPFEYLSSGFKASLAMLLGIARELEVRNVAEQASEFDGVILVDELELHLHPAWQRQIVRILRQAFPRVQFVVTTHSPHVLQSARPNEIISLTREGMGDTRVQTFSTGKFGLQGWTLEEILEHVMGVTDTSSTLYRDNVHAFDRAIDKGDFREAKRLFDELEAMLHPANQLRKLLRLQIASIQDDQ